jgi:hypothetical protein
VRPALPETATPSGRFTILLTTLLPGSGEAPGPAANFDPSRSYTWRAFELAEGATLAGAFDPGAFNIITAGEFANAFDGTFRVALDGSHIAVFYTPVPEPAGL